MIVLIDNYDSFTYNLYHLIALFDPQIEVVRNNLISCQKIEKLNPSAIIISPGPGSPSEAGICLEMIRTFASSIPILGICLGMQAIAQAFGGLVIRAPICVHGKASLIDHQSNDLFKNMSNPFEAARYHSLCVERKSLPKELCITAQTADGLIMALSHQIYPLYGVQFHPESILTSQGEKLMSNFFVLMENFWKNEDREFSADKQYQKA